MSSRIETVNDLLHRTVYPINLHHRTSLPVTPPPVNVISTTNVENKQNSQENLRICIKHTQKEYFFICPEKFCMHQVENDKYAMKDHVLEFHSKKAEIFNLTEDNDTFCFFCSKCNKYTVTIHYHCQQCPKWDLTAFKSMKDLENNHIHVHSEIISPDLRTPNKWPWW